MERPNVTNKGCLLSIVLIIMGIFSLVVLITVVVDGECESGGRYWLPAYPEAELIEEDYSFIRMWGIGESYRVFFTPDDTNTVRRWYQQSDRANVDEFRDRGGATLGWRLRQGEDGGTHITLYSECAKTLDLSPLGIRP